MWNETTIAQLLNLWGKFSAAQIAAEIGTTRNSVLGKAHRLGLSSPRPKSANTRLKLKRAKNYFVPARPPRAATKPKPLPIEITPPSLEMRPVTLAELNNLHCRWPIGDPHKEDFRFCGADKEIERSYCAFHAGLAYVPADKRQAQRRRELKAQRLAARYAGAHL